MAQPPDDRRQQRLVDALTAALLLADHIVTASRELHADSAQLLNAVERAVAALPPPRGRKEPPR